MTSIAFASPAVWAADSNTPSLDSLLNLPVPATQPASHPGQAPAAKQGVPINAGVARRLEGSQPHDLFKQALVEMSEASDRLGKGRDAGEDTQRLQEAVLAKLDQIIADAQSQQQQSSSSSSSSSSKSQSQSNQKRDTGSKQNQEPQGQNNPNSKSGQAKSNFGKGENNGQNQVAPGGVPAVTPTALHQMRSEWGNLPKRVRDELLEGLKEPYSAPYEVITERYYRALAEQGK